MTIKSCIFGSTMDDITCSESFANNTYTDLVNGEPYSMSFSKYLKHFVVLSAVRLIAVRCCGCGLLPWLRIALSASTVRHFIISDYILKRFDVG